MIVGLGLRATAARRRPGPGRRSRVPDRADPRPRRGRTACVARCSPPDGRPRRWSSPGAAAQSPGSQGSGVGRDDARRRRPRRHRAARRRTTCPTVTLDDAAGARYDLATDATKPVTLVFFGYTHCPDICQVVMANIASAMTRLDAAQTGPRSRWSSSPPTRPATTPPTLRELPGPLRPVLRRPDRRPARDRQARQGVRRARSRRARSSPSGGYDVAHGTQIVGVLPGRHGRRSSGPRAPTRPRWPTTSPRSSTTRCPDCDLSDPALHPQPRPGRLAPRPAPDPRLRAVHHPRRRRRDLDGRAPLGGPRRRARPGLATSRSGRCRSGWSAVGSTT